MAILWCGSKNIDFNSITPWASSSNVVEAGHLVTVLFPAQDATWAGVFMLIKGTRSVL